MAAIQNINEAWGGTNPHTGLEVETYIKNYLRNLTISTNSRIKDIKFERTSGSTINYTIIKTDNDTGVDYEETGSFTLEVVSEEKIYIENLSTDDYISPGSDLVINYSYRVVDENQVQVQRQPSIIANIKNGTYSKELEIGLANRSNSAGNKAGTIRISSEYIKEGVNEISITFTYSNTSGTATATADTLYVLSFTPNLTIEDNNISLTRIYNVENDKITFSPRITDSNSVSLSSGKYATYNNNIYRIVMRACSPTLGNIILSENSFTLKNVYGEASAIGTSTFYLQAVIQVPDGSGYKDVAYTNGIQYQLLSSVDSINSTRFAYKLDNCPQSNGSLSFVSNVTSVTQYDDFDLKIYADATNGTTFTYVVDGETFEASPTSEDELYNLSWKYNVKASNSSTVSVVASTGNSVSFTINVVGLNNDLDVPTDYAISLASNGKTGKTTDWTSNGYKTTFTGFDWAANGWKENALVTNNGAKAVIGYTPCSTTLGTYGRTVSFRFKTSNENTEEELIKCYVAGRDGFIIYPQKAVVYRGSSSIETKFTTEGSYKEVTFVWYPASYGNLTIIYVNGTSQAVLTGGTSSLNTAQITLTSNLTSLYLTNVVCYNKALNFSEVQSIYNTNNAGNITDYIKANNIFGDSVTIGNNGQKVTIDSLPVGSRYMLVKAHPDGVSKFWEVINSLKARYDGVESKSWRLLAGNTYLITKVADGQPADEHNFFADKITISGQGTSSMSYPIKNFRIYFKKKLTYSNKATSDFPEEGSIDEKAGYTQVFKQGSDVTSINYTTDSGDSPIKYRLSEDSMPANIFCLKADYAESSGMHNTGFARMANWVLETSKDISSNKESVKYPLNAVNEAKSQPYPTRSTVDGIPVYLFFEDIDGNQVYHGKYNLNNEKANAEVYGFIPNGKDYQSYFDNTTVQAEAENLKKLFGITDDSYDITHEEIESYNGVKYINPTECWEFSTNDADSLAFSSNDSRWVYLRQIGAFTFPYTKGVTNYPFSNNAAFSGLNPFEVRTTDGELAWLNTEQAWEYRYPDFDDTDEGNKAYTGQGDWSGKAVKPYLLESLYKWLHRNNVYCWDSGNRDSHAAMFARYLHYYFNVNYLLKYYVLTKMFINGDQRIKNCMLAFICDPDADNNDGTLMEGGYFTGTHDCPMGHMRAFYIFYDNDTILGVDNTGALTNSWNSDETSDVFRGITTNETTFHGVRQGESFHAIWGNIEYCYKAYIDNTSTNEYVLNLGKLVEKTYDALRLQLTDGKIKEFFDSSFPDAASNVDAEIKYFYPTALNPSTTVDNFDTGNIEQYQGSRQYHREWLLDKRLKWFDARYGSGSVENYYLNYKVYGTLPWTHNEIKCTSVFNNWRFYYKGGDKASLIPSSMLSSGEVGNVYHTSTIDSNECFVLGLYGCSKLDLSGWYGNTSSTAVNSISEGEPLPYLTELIIGNADNPFYVTDLNSFYSKTPNLTSLTIQNVKLNTEGAFSMDCSELTKLTYINTTNTLSEIVLPEGSLLSTLIMYKPSSLTFKDKLNLTNLTVEDWTGLTEITVEHSNNKLYQEALRQYIANPEIDLTIVFGTTSERDTLSVTTMEALLQVAHLIVDNGYTNAKVSGIGYFQGITSDISALLYNAFGANLNISSTDSKEFDLTLDDGAYLYENNTLKISSTLPASNWILNAVTPDGFNGRVYIQETTPYSCILKADPCGDNSSYNFSITVSAENEGVTKTTNTITVMYIPITRVTLSVTGSDIISSPTAINADIGTTTKSYLLNETYKNNISVTATKGTAEIAYNSDGTFGSVQYTPELNEDGNVTLTIFQISGSILLYYNSPVCAKSDLSTNTSLEWLRQLTSGYSDSFDSTIYRTDLYALTVTTADGSLRCGTNTVSISDQTTTDSQDLSYLKYFKGSSETFNIPYNIRFTNLEIPEGFTSINWTSILGDYTGYGTIIFPSSIKSAFVQLSLNSMLSDLQFDISKATTLTKIYNASKQGEQGVFSFSLTVQEGSVISTGSKSLFVYHNGITQIGQYSTSIRTTKEVPTSAMFNISNVSIDNSNSSYPPMYLLGEPVNKNGYVIGAISSYRLGSQVLDWDICSQYVTGLYYTFYRGSGTGSSQNVTFPKLTFIGEEAFGLEDQSETGWNSVTIPSTITAFGYGAFVNHQNPVNTTEGSYDVYAPNATIIGPLAFQYSNCLSFYFTNLNQIGARAFNNSSGRNVNIRIVTEYSGTSIANSNDLPFGQGIATIAIVTNSRAVHNIYDNYASYATINYENN